VDGCPISGSRHEAVEDVELTDKMALADAADRRVARHLSRIFGSEGEQPDTRAAAGRSGRSLAPGMAGADHQNVVHEAELIHVSRHCEERMRRSNPAYELLDCFAALATTICFT
jgi:hypothetical protein